jgi:hypothetical protein
MEPGVIIDFLTRSTDLHTELVKASGVAARSAGSGIPRRAASRPR